MQRAEQVLTDLITRFRPEAASGMKATFQLQLDGDEGGSWHMVVADGKCELRQGTAAEPDVSVAMTTQDFGDLIAQRLDVMQAYSDGRVKVSGNLFLAMQLGELFGF